MFGMKLATYAFGVAGLAIAAPAMADNPEDGRSFTAASSAAGFRFDGSKGQGGAHGFFAQLRGRELEQARRGGWRGGKGQGHGHGHGNGYGHGNGHGNGHGHGHGHGHCDDDDRCHASPG